MDPYMSLKGIHMLTAYITALLLLLRMGLDVTGQVGWRGTPLKWMPHANDTVLLASALGLLWVTPWMPFVHHWLTVKLLLLVGYIFAGKWALDQHRSAPVRVTAAVLALLQLLVIFAMAFQKPF